MKLKLEVEIEVGNMMKGWKPAEVRQNVFDDFINAAIMQHLHLKMLMLTSDKISSEMKKLSVAHNDTWVELLEKATWDVRVE